MSSGWAKAPSLLLAVVVSQGMARDKPEIWLEVQSPHFIVVSNAGEREARRIADRFERIRSVFHTAFPRMHVDSDLPIIVLAAKDEKSFKTMVPESWLEKGQLAPVGGATWWKEGFGR